MERQVLSIKEMEELDAMGISTSKASAYWYKEPKATEKCQGENGYLIGMKFLMVPIDSHKIPTFTLQDILETLPKFINVGEKTYFLTLMYDVSDGVVIAYCTEHINEILHSEGHSEQLTACFNMLKWCKQNKHL